MSPTDVANSVPLSPALVVAIATISIVAGTALFHAVLYLGKVINTQDAHGRMLDEHGKVITRHETELNMFKSGVANGDRYSPRSR